MAELGRADIVSANGDQWEESLKGGTLLRSCDLHATSSGMMSCFDISPKTQSDGRVITTTHAFPEDIRTVDITVESSLS
jgi:hypothetical protein